MEMPTFSCLCDRGCGYHGQLGHGIEKDELSPKEVTVDFTTDIDEVIVHVACGESHTIAVSSTGAVYTWGNNSCGRTGQGKSQRIARLPRLVRGGDFATGIGGRRIIIGISASASHTACVSQEGEVFTFGSGNYGKLGHGNEDSSFVPILVKGLVGIKVAQVSCGHFHTAFCTENGGVYTCGEGENGKLGHGDYEDRYTPELVHGLDGLVVIQVQCGIDHSMALTKEGYVFTWGENGRNGKLGLLNGNEPQIQIQSLSLPNMVEELIKHKISQIATFREHSMVLANSSPCPLRLYRRNLLNREDNSDVTFLVDKNTEPVYAHTDILCDKNEYFQAMFRSNMRESIERVVRVSSCSRDTFLMLLEYIYTNAPLKRIVPPQEIVELYYLADMHFVEGLKHSCLAALEKRLSTDRVNYHKDLLEQIESYGDSCGRIKDFLFLFYFNQSCREASFVNEH